MMPVDFFLQPISVAQKQYEALRMYFVDKKPALDVAINFGYTYRGFTTIVSDFKKKISAGKTDGLYLFENKKVVKLVKV